MLAKQSFPILEAQRMHSEKSILNSGLNNVQCRDKIVFAPLQGKIRRNYFYLPPAAGEMVGQCQNNFTLLFSDGVWNGEFTTEDHDSNPGPTPTLFDGGMFGDGITQGISQASK